MCVCVCVCVKWLSCVWLFVTPWTVARQAPLSVEFSRQENCSGLLFPSPGDLPYLGIEPGSLMSPVLAGGFYISVLPGKAPKSPSSLLNPGNSIVHLRNKIPSPNSFLFIICLKILMDWFMVAFRLSHHFFIPVHFLYQLKKMSVFP